MQPTRAPPTFCPIRTQNSLESCDSSSHRRTPNLNISKLCCLCSAYLIVQLPNFWRIVFAPVKIRDLLIKNLAHSAFWKNQVKISGVISHPVAEIYTAWNTRGMHEITFHVNAIFDVAMYFRIRVTYLVLRVAECVQKEEEGLPECAIW